MARVSGLDPAGPFFEKKDKAVRLDRDDAKFVDVIHSNGEPSFGLGLGLSEPSGHVDFYVNGGQHQPGCPSLYAHRSERFFIRLPVRLAFAYDR